MFVEFQQITFKNFLSYGNRPTTFELQRGMNLITGINGCGKSVILDAISFALYGQPYRKIKISELINRRNGKHLETEILFKIDENQYKIERGLNPAKISVFKNNEELELLSSKKLTQTELDKMIGIDHNLFRQIISLAISYNRPFLSLPAGEKRDIIENIFGIKIFGEMLKILKKNTSGIRTQTEISKKTIELLETSIKGLRKQIRDTKTAIKDFEQNRKADIKNIQDKIDRIQKEMDGFIKTKEKNIQKIILIDLEKHAKKYGEIPILEREMEADNVKLKNLFNDEKILKENSICPFCNSEIEEQRKQKTLELIEIKKKSLTEKLKNADEKLTILNKECSQSIFQIEINKEIENQNKMIDEKIVFYQKEIDSLKLDIETINTRNINFNVENLETMLNEKSSEYTEVYKQYHEFVKVSKTNDIVSMILSEEGVKSYFFKKLIPLLNSKINEVLNKFDLPLQLRFNELMEEEIHNYTNGNYVVNYYSLSEGEKKRIDMAILLAFITTTKIINNWNCNLILMDELLDSSVDGEGLDKMIDCLRTYITDSKNLICIYLISHRSLESQFFNTIYTIRKNHGFSEIEIKSA